MKTQIISSWKKTFSHLFAIYGAAYAGVISEIDFQEEESWLGIG